MEPSFWWRKKKGGEGGEGRKKREMKIKERKKRPEKEKKKKKRGRKIKGKKISASPLGTPRRSAQRRSCRRADIGRTDGGPPPAHRRAAEVGTRHSSPMPGEASGSRELAMSPAVLSEGTAPPGISIDLWNVLRVRKAKPLPLSLALCQQCKLRISVWALRATETACEQILLAAGTDVAAVRAACNAPGNVPSALTLILVRF